MFQGLAGLTCGQERRCVDTWQRSTPCIGLVIPGKERKKGGEREVERGREEVRRKGGREGGGTE